MMLRKIAASMAATALLTAAPAIAQSKAAAAPADARAGASLEEPNAIEGAGLMIYLIGAALLAIAVWGILELTEDDEPASP